MHYNIYMIDVNFDFQREAGYRDSDRYSPTLREYHRLLWSRELPCGKYFNLEYAPNNCLKTVVNGVTLILSSDRAVASFIRNKKVLAFIDTMDKDAVTQFKSLTDTIGGIVIWPANRIDGKMTINGARGFSRQISDRLDLTMECIRLYYLDLQSPLYETLKRYDSFFKLFVSFRGFIDFFLLNDYVSSDYTKCIIAPPQNYNFCSCSVPANVKEYTEYMRVTSDLVRQRNNRIEQFAVRHGL